MHSKTNRDVDFMVATWFSVIDCMHHHLLLRGYVPIVGSSTEDVRLQLVTTADGSVPWRHVKGVMESTWMEWCCRRMLEAKEEADASRPVRDEVLRVCRSLRQSQQPYHE